MGDEIDIGEDIAQLIRDVAAPRDAEIARLRAKCVAWKAEIAQLRALASQLGQMAGESSESSERKICPIAETRDEGAGAKRARDEDAPICVVLCGEEDCGELVELPCGHHIHLDCVMMLLIVNKKTLCPACRAPMAQSDYAKSKLRAFEEVENEMSRLRASRELAVALQETPDDDDDVRVVEIRRSAEEQAEQAAIAVSTASPSTAKLRAFSNFSHQFIFSF